MDLAGRLKKDLPGISNAKVLGAVDSDHDMINIAANLKHRFWQFEYDLLECWDALGFPTTEDTDPDWTTADDRTAAILGELSKTVDAVPDEQPATKKALYERNPAAFDQVATSLIRAVGVTFFLENASSFCEVLNDGLR